MGHDSGPRPDPAKDEGTRPTDNDCNNTIIGDATDNGKCQSSEVPPQVSVRTVKEAVESILAWEAYRDSYLGGYDHALLTGAQVVDDAVKAFSAASTEEARAAAAETVNQTIQNLRYTPEPSARNQIESIFATFDADDLFEQWTPVETRHPDLVLEWTLEALPERQAASVRTFLGGADHRQLVSLYRAIRVLGWGWSFTVTCLGLPSVAARARGVSMDDLPDVIAREWDPAAGVRRLARYGAHDLPDCDWVSQLALLTREVGEGIASSRAVSSGPRGALAPEIELMTEVVEGLAVEVVRDGVADAQAVQEGLEDRENQLIEVNLDDLAAAASGAAIEVVKVLGVPVTLETENAALTMGEVIHQIHEQALEAQLAQLEAETQRHLEEEADAQRREAVAATKAERITAKKQRQHARKAANRARREAEESRRRLASSKCAECHEQPPRSPGRACEGSSS